MILSWITKIISDTEHKTPLWKHLTFRNRQSLTFVPSCPGGFNELTFDSACSHCASTPDSACPHCASAPDSAWWDSPNSSYERSLIIIILNIIIIVVISLQINTKV